MDGDDSLFSAGAAELVDGDDLFSYAGSSKNAKVLDGNDSFSSAGSSKDTELIGVARGGAQGARAPPNQNTTNDKKL